MENVDSYIDGRESFRIANESVGEKNDAGISCLKDESGVAKVSVNG